MNAVKISVTLILIALHAVIIPNTAFAAEENNTAAALFDKGKSAYDQGDLEAALIFFEQGIAKDEKNSDAWLHRCFVLRRLGRITDELACWNRCIELFPDEPFAWRNTGIALLYDKQYTKAIERFDKAIMLDHKLGVNYFQRGECYFLMGHYKNALDDFNHAQTLGFSNQTMDREILWLNRLLRQFEGRDIPPKDWRPDYDAYQRIVEHTKFGGMLVSIMEERAPAQKIRFKGTKKDPLSFAPGFLVWNGAWINDPEYGLLLENGTKVKHIIVEGDKQIVNIGRIEGWKIHIKKQKKEEIHGK